MKVKEIAESKGYNMSSLSRASDVSFTTVKRIWKHPELGAHIDTLVKIAKTLKVTVNDLIEEVED